MRDEGNWGRNIIIVIEKGLEVSKCRCVLIFFYFMYDYRDF